MVFSARNMHRSADGYQPQLPRTPGSKAAERQSTASATTERRSILQAITDFVKRSKDPLKDIFPIDSQGNVITPFSPYRKILRDGPEHVSLPCDCEPRD